MAINIQDLSKELAQNVPAILDALGLVGKKSGGRLRFVCPWSGDDYSKIDVRLSHPKGQWKRWNGNEAGDIFDLIAYCEGNGTRDRGAAYRWACDFLGYDRRKLSPEEQKAQDDLRAKRRRENDLRNARAEKEYEENLSKNRSRAFAKFCSAKKIQKNDIVWNYFLARGIDLGALGEIPKLIRFLDLEEHRCDETGEITKWPCMISAMWLRNGDFAAIHRTWIDLNSPKTSFKAPIIGAKKMWPSNQGAFIPISRGLSKIKAADALPKSETVYVFEGIENALSFAFLRPDARIDVAGSLSLIMHYPTPLCARELLIGADKFDNKNAQKMLAKVIDTQKQKHGIEVRVNYAPGNYKDWNAALMGQKI